ncbi:hypothetical protein KAJ41_00525 [Candidatus Parcubacteria bacterium]|nr:hypothetical protein [Candidatus Parcubacteria bacterium]
MKSNLPPGEFRLLDFNFTLERILLLINKINPSFSQNKKRNKGKKRGQLEANIVSISIRDKKGHSFSEKISLTEKGIKKLQQRANNSQIQLPATIELQI